MILAACATWTLLALWRVGFAIAADSIWAEDGAVFLQQQRDLGFWAAFAVPYHGYLHVVPRLAAWAAGQAPLQAAALWLSLLAAAATAACALAVSQASRPHIASRTVRLGLATYLVLLPSGGKEVLGNVACLQWPLSMAAGWVLLGPLSTGAEVWAGGVLLSLTALSTPTALVF